MWWSTFYNTGSTTIVEKTIYRTEYIMKELILDIENPIIPEVIVSLDVEQKQLDISIDPVEQIELTVSIEKNE